MQKNASSTPLLGGIEGGGTKFVCAVADSPETPIAQVRFPTTSPEETLARALDFFRSYPIVSLGVGSFGPLDLDPASPAFGTIINTPKPGWVNTHIRAQLAQALNVPVQVDTDVNAAALGEYTFAPRQVASLVYMTIGTGIGAGVITGGHILRGFTHPEIGHIRIPHDKHADPFPGICPFHADCLEGLASGPALTARWNSPADGLPQDHPAWELEAQYLAFALVDLLLTLVPQRIILGGGVMQRAFLFPLIRSKVKAALNEYLQVGGMPLDLEEIITPPTLGDRSGLTGALVMARSAWLSSSKEPISPIETR